VRRVFHPPRKHASLPFPAFSPDNPSYVTVVLDRSVEGAPLYRLYYQANFRLPDAPEKGKKYRTDVAYAESRDGVSWIRPNLDLFPEKSGWASPNNIVVGISGRPEAETNGPFLVENVPVEQRRGYRFLLLHRVSGRGCGDIAGIRLTGSSDGIHFDEDGAHRLAHLHSDTANAICYDPARGHFQLFCRAKQLYRRFRGDMIDTGASRRIATMRQTDLWSDWLAHGEPQTLLVPDEVDAETGRLYFYGMPTVHRHGLYWGGLQCFRLNDYVHTELVTSRDGVHWDRLPSRPALVPFGPEDSWDDTMIFASPGWVESGNEWRFYYTGWDGPHGTAERSGNVGMAACLRERLFARRGPVAGGVVCTREITWPGGDLWINAAQVPEADDCAISVRISGDGRDTHEGFDHADSRLLTTDDPTRTTVQWGEKSLDAFAGRPIRIEFLLRDADLFTFGATAPPER